MREDRHGAATATVDHEHGCKKSVTLMDQLLLQRGKANAEAHGCILCAGSTLGARSTEHIVPKALGNEELVLPPGVVCDRCNNGVLSQLDAALVDFLPIKFRCTLLGIGGRSGVPTTRFAEGTVSRSAPDNVVFWPSSNRAMFRETSLPDGQTRLDFRLTGGRRLNATYGRLLHRGLLKVGLELRWLEAGDQVHRPSLDGVRKRVQGLDKAPAYVAIARKGDPTSERVAIDTFEISVGERSGLAVGADIYGVSMVTDSCQTALDLDLDEERVLLLRC
jgi:hypothetical protein